MYLNLSDSFSCSVVMGQYVVSWGSRVGQCQRPRAGKRRPCANYGSHHSIITTSSRPNLRLACLPKCKLCCRAKKNYRNILSNKRTRGLA